MNLYLIGYRGTGKTTVGRQLADQLGWHVVDADEWLERKADRTIREIFALEGEVAFRDLESAVLEELAGLDQTVISLGGGAVLREQNRKLLQGRGTVIWLQANPQTIWERLNADCATSEHRPDLTDSGGYAEIVELLNRRAPIYRDCADLLVDTESRTPEQVVAQIVFLLGDGLSNAVTDQ